MPVEPRPEQRLEEPAADWAEQQEPLDPDDEVDDEAVDAGLEADHADVAEQARALPDEDPYPPL